MLLPCNQTQIAHKAYSSVVARMRRLMIETGLRQRIRQHPLVVHVRPLVERGASVRLAAHVTLVEARHRRYDTHGRLILNQCQVQAVETVQEQRYDRYGHRLHVDSLDLVEALRKKHNEAGVVVAERHCAPRATYATLSAHLPLQVGHELVQTADAVRLERLEAAQQVERIIEAHLESFNGTSKDGVRALAHARLKDRVQQDLAVVGKPTAHCLVAYYYALVLDVDDVYLLI